MLRGYHRARYVPEAFLHVQGGWSSKRRLQAMYRAVDIEEEEVLEFNLIQRLTFLEYLPVRSGIRKSSSSPELTVECDPCSTSPGPQKESWGRLVSVSTDCSSGATWSRQESTHSRCLTFHDALVNAASTKSDNSATPTDFADLEIPETGSSGSELGTCGQWSVGSALHSQGDCKPCAWTLLAWLSWWTEVEIVEGSSMFSNVFHLCEILNTFHFFHGSFDVQS